MSTKKRLFYCLFLAGSLWSCNSDSDKLTPIELQSIDTLYSKQIRILVTELDSICELHKDSLIQVAADSMVKKRLEEMEKILNRQ